MISLLGIPYDASSSYLRGPALAPDLVREAINSPSSNLSIENGRVFGDEIEDVGNLTLEEGPAHRDVITEAVRKELLRGHKTLALGGDHSISFPLIRAHAEKTPNLNVLQFDAHPDLYDELNGDRFSHASPFARLLEEFPDIQLTQIGIRTLNHHCDEQALRFGVRMFEMRDLPAPSALDIKGPLYVSIDLDVLDPGCAPGVSHHEPGGMSVRDLLRFIHMIKNPIVGADIVEYNPTRDFQGMTAMVAAKITKEVAGQMLENG